MEFVQNLNNFSMVSSYINSFGILAPAVAFLLFVLQAALPVFPYIILASVGGFLFGFKVGAFLAWSGALVGASLAYWFSRYFLTDHMINFIERKFNYSVSEVNGELAFWTIVITRIVPVIPTPIINVVAALSGVKFWNFLFSSALGKIPSAVLYTGLGIYLFNSSDIKLTLLIIAAILIFLILARYLAKNKFNIISR